jgi:hypothetical protein
MKPIQWVRLAIAGVASFGAAGAGAFTPLHDSFSDLGNWTTSVAVDPAGIALSSTGVVFTASAADQYQRQDIKTTGLDYGWLSAGDVPVTYTFTITNFPASNFDGFEAHLMLIGNASGGNYADYNQANVIYFKVFDYGSAYGAELYFKANAASSSIYSGRKAASFYNQTSPLGTWGITLHGTNVAIFGPHDTNSGTILPSALTAFDVSTVIYVGVNPNGTGNLGESATISSVTAIASGVTSPPPALSIRRDIPGLEINANITGGAGTYQRQDIRTVDGPYTWINSFTPVTYAFTISSFPDASYNGFEAHFLLVGNKTNPGAYGDYNEANVIYLRAFDYGNGFGAELRYKINKAFSSIYGPFANASEGGTAASFYSAPTMIGTWGVTLSGVNVTLFGPGGQTNVGVLPDNVSTSFDSTVYVYLGINPNGDANIGQAATFSGVALTGFDTIGGFNGSLVDNFTDLNNWTTSVTQDSNGVLLKPAGTRLRLSWPGPANGFVLQFEQNAADLFWTDSPLPVQALGTQRVVFSDTATSTGFFQLRKP